jgi:hypothetical protein
MRSAPPVRGGLGGALCVERAGVSLGSRHLPGAMADDLSSILSIALLYDLPIDSRC